MRDICERCHNQADFSWRTLNVVKVEVGDYRRDWHLCDKCAVMVRDWAESFIRDVPGTVSRDVPEMATVTHPTATGDSRVTWEMTTYPDTGDNTQMYIDSPDRTV